MKPVQKRDRRSRIPEQYKRDAVRLSEEQGVKVTADQLGICMTTLSKWRKKYLSKEAAPSEKAMSYAELLAENHEIKRKMRILEDINEVLKKSTAILSMDHFGGIK